LDGPIDAEKDFGTYLNFLEKMGLLKRITQKLATEDEIGDFMYRSSVENGPALLFENPFSRDLHVEYDIPLVGSLLCTRERAAMAIGTTEDKALEKCIAAQEHPVPSLIVEEDPYERKVLQDSEIDLLRLLPISKCSPGDGGKYIGTGVIFARDPEYGRNVSISRHQVLGKNKLGILAVPPQHTGIFIRRAVERGENLQVSIALACAPDIVISSQFKPQIGIDESSFAGGLRGEPIKLVRGKKVKNEFPISAHIVIEGEISNSLEGPEGPFGEYTGYYGERCEKQTVIEVKAVLIRQDIRPVFYGSCPMPIENDIIKELPLEASTLLSVRRSCPGVRNVRCPTFGGSEDFVVIQIHKTYEDEGKVAILAGFPSGARPKIVVVVDDDVNIFDDAEVLNAITYRMQPHKDVTIVRTAGKPLDPSFLSKSPDGGSALGIDATKPLKVAYCDRIENHSTTKEKKLEKSK
jgi:2,5-furandicarboxylate decarboxylase 1